MSLAYVKKICLFGGAGFVGRSIVRLLAKRGFEVKIATRSPFDEDLLEDARYLASKIIIQNPKLNNDDGQKLKNLLYIQERDTAIKTLMAG